MSDPAPTSLAFRLMATIRAHGPLPIAAFMAAANTAYYAKGDPLGAAGDFITAPEISQMFGEIIGLWATDRWMKAGRPPLTYVELGPGRGTLAADALRAMAQFGLIPDVCFIEHSPYLRAVQAARVPRVQFADDVTRLPGDGALFVVANEFFDALPIHQYVRGPTAWHERCVGMRDDRFVLVHAPQPTTAAIPPRLADAPEGSMTELCPLATRIMAAVAAQFAARGGAMLAIDYGYDGPALGDTLQAVRAHKFADPFTDPGAQDLTAHVDFGALAQAARAAGAHVAPLTDQGTWLEMHGIVTRERSLGRRDPGKIAALRSARHRLTDPSQMGQLFKVLEALAPHWAEPRFAAD